MPTITPKDCPFCHNPPAVELDQDHLGKIYRVDCEDHSYTMAGEGHFKAEAVDNWNDNVEAAIASGVDDFDDLELDDDVNP